MKRVLSGLALAATLAMPSFAQEVQVGRFGVQVNLPVGLNDRDLHWIMGEAPTNDDGRAFTLDGAPVMVAVYGSYLWQDDFAQAVAMAEDYAEEGESEITYRAGGARWAVLSGYRADGTVFYHRMELAADCDDDGDVLINVMIERGPDATWFDALTGAIAESLRGCRE
ncbi:MAG: hypothetical protein VX874_07665 [Pseudomonadota bacterium]|nr:hypothetical protein [Pseudomonadota bacterium]